MLVLLFSANTFIPEFKGKEDENADFIGRLQYKYSNAHQDSNGFYTCPNYTDYCTLVSYSTDYNIDGSENY